MELDRPTKRVCDVLEAPRSTIYARDKSRVPRDDGVVIALPKRGPRTELSDEELLVAIRKIIVESPFAGEGHRKVTARLRREQGVCVGRKRVLRLMRPWPVCWPRSVPRGAVESAATMERSSLELRI